MMSQPNDKICIASAELFKDKSTYPAAVKNMKNKCKRKPMSTHSKNAIQLSRIDYRSYQIIKICIFATEGIEKYRSCTSGLGDMPQILFANTSHSNSPSLHKILQWHLCENI